MRSSLADPASQSSVGGSAVIHEDAFLKVTRRAGTARDADRGGQVLVSFTGVRQQMGGVELDRPEFVGTAGRYDDAFFVHDLRRTWGNGFDFAVLADVLAPLIQGRPTDVIGNSMGGHNAIVAAGYLQVEHCLTFGPQWSVDPAVVPGETRWGAYRRQIGKFARASLAGCFNDTTRYRVLFGLQKLDRAHFDLFPVLPNLDCVGFPEMDHNVALVLKERGLLQPFVAHSMSGGDIVDWLKLNMDETLEVKSRSRTQEATIIRKAPHGQV